MKHFNKGVWSSKNVFLNNVQTPLETHMVYLPSSCKRWISTKIDWSELQGKTLTLPKYKDIIIDFMTQTREKLDSLV